MRTVIIGGVAGGASCAARLRRLQEDREIVILERGEFVSFANCGLPYYIGGEITDERLLTLQTPKSFKSRFNIDVRVFNEAISIDKDKKTVTVRDLRKGENYELEYDTLVLSPGAAPIKPKIEGLDLEGVFTLRNIPDTMQIKNFIDEKKPQTALVVGGGYIGIEMAENLKKAGLKVTLAELADHLIASLDVDMSCDIEEYVKENEIKLILENGVQKIEKAEKGLLVSLKDEKISVDMVILSVGVKPDTEIAKTAGVSLSERGHILVNDKMETNIKDIYAVGDAIAVTEFVTGEVRGIPLAGPANKQGRIAADNIAGLDSRYKGTQGSSVLKVFDMTVATTGINETTAKRAGFDYDKTYTYSASHATYYPHAQFMSLKVLWDKKTEKILGAQIVGFDGVDKRCDVLATAIRLGAKVRDLKDLELCYAPPFGSAKDPVNMIGFIAENIITGKLKQYFWHDVEELKCRKDITLLDVRTKTEANRGMIDGFINIPLDSLRENLDRIPKDKPVYIHCHSGLRSYIACRILTGYGYDCYNLAGGHRLYESVVNQNKVQPYICTECK